MSIIRPIPDRDSAAWWARAARHEFVLQGCDACGTLRFPARAYCHACRSKDWSWRPVEPTGTIESWIVTHQAFTPGAATPYVVVMVRLTAAPDCVMYGNWCRGREPHPGELVQASFTYVDEELSLINWRPGTE
ncbi:Zn-ribbon domain-containing OB-fold protein [Planotetraspora sp. GP83]|uniref:Zn-ribbon domain-containing OB-fold protein n=1 Tax=Planotetraspora sp. GP83 TaxID=3156264 RepID=UPI0035185073